MIERAHLVAVVVVAVGAGDEDVPPGPVVRRQPDGGLQPRVRHGKQQREGKEAEGRHGRCND